MRVNWLKIIMKGIVVQEVIEQKVYLIRHREKR